MKLNWLTTRRYDTQPGGVYHGTCHARSQSPCRKAASDPFIIALFSIITHKQGKDPGSNPGPPDLQASVLPNALPPPWLYTYVLYILLYTLLQFLLYTGGKQVATLQLIF